MKINAKIIHAFAVEGNGGNPAGVVLNADHLSQMEKQQVARQLRFPETAFVSQSNVADFKLEFFTPIKQIPHCGHATIATFTYLKKNGFISGNRSSKETIDGTRKILFDGQYAYMEQRAPTFLQPAEELPVILDSLKLASSDLAEGLGPTIVNTGNAFLMVPVRDEEILASLKPAFDKISSFSERYGLIGYYLFTPSRTNSSVQATARMFAPYYGIEEEAGTGMAAGPLACFLYTYTADKRDQYLVEQGRFMQTPSPSLLYVRLKIRNGAIENLYVGGDAYVKDERWIEL